MKTRTSITFAQGKHSFAVGRYLGFLASMLIFSAILFFVTSKLHWHAQPYYIFIPALCIVFPLIITAKRRLTHQDIYRQGKVAA